MLKATAKPITTFCVGDVVTLKKGGPRMTVTHVGPRNADGGDWLLCQWFDEHGEFRQDRFAQEMVSGQPRSISPGLVQVRRYAGVDRSPA